jgi:acetyl esterase/lipase
MRRIADLSYRPGNPACLADLYLPDASAADCLIWLYGGGLTAGCKGEGMHLLPPPGWALAIPNYRLLSQAPWPACIEDAAAVVAWVRGALAAQGVTCRRLFLAGASAGAYLTAMVALDRRWLSIHGLDPSTLAGVIPVSGQMTTHFAYKASIGLRAGQPMIDAAAPLWHVRGDAPPMRLIVGGNDIPCRLEENQLMLAAMRDAGHRATDLHVVPGRDHGGMGSGLNDPADAVLRLLHGFLQAGG